MDTYEFKLSETGKRWEDIPVSLTINGLSHHYAGIVARNMARKYKKEVRYNVKGSLQGYYVPLDVFCFIKGGDAL